MMEIPVVKSVVEMQARSEHLRLGGHRIALVPTMGALHEGHLALVREARKHGDVIVVSVFVNPTQFGSGEDLDRYPRRLDQDTSSLRQIGGVDAVFAPPVDEIYPYGAGQERTRAWVEVSGLDEHLCGRFRPGHFRGVTTVVTKLFNACRPHAAVFGLKDAQQFVIIRRMVSDLLMAVEIVGVPTVREPDGLAMSSRNEYLTPEERSQAVVLNQAVKGAAGDAKRGELPPQAIVERMRSKIQSAPLAALQYAQVVDAELLQPVGALRSGMEVVVAAAAYFGGTRLIDSAFTRVS